MSVEDSGYNVLDPSEQGPGAKFLKGDFANAAGGFFKGLGKAIKGMASNPTGGLVLGGFAALLAFPLIQSWTSNLMSKFNIGPPWVGKLMGLVVGLGAAFFIGDAVTKWGANQNKDKEADGSRPPLAGNKFTGVSEDKNGDPEEKGASGNAGPEQELARELEKSVKEELGNNPDFRAALAQDLRETARGRDMDSEGIRAAVDEVIELTAAGAGDNFLNILNQYDLTVEARADGTMDIKGEGLSQLMADAHEWEAMGEKQRQALLDKMNQDGQQPGELRSIFRDKHALTLTQNNTGNNNDDMEQNREKILEIKIKHD